MTPRVSVVMTAYNAEATIAAAIDSVLRQDLDDFELVIVDDGSSDRTAVIVGSLTDPRVRVESPGRIGRSASVNHAVAVARAPLIAIADADDISLPGRLLGQADFLDAHPDVDVLGGQVVAFWGRHEWHLTYPTSHEEIHAELVRGRMPIAHACAMLRRTWFIEQGGLDTDLDRVEDFALYYCSRASGRFAALPTELVRYRCKTLTRIQWQHDDDLWAKIVGQRSTSRSRWLRYARYRSALWSQRRGLGLTAR